MGNCNCLERPRVMAWDDDYDWGLKPAARSGEERTTVAMENGGMKVKIRMTKGQLRRLLEGAGHGGSSTDEDVVEEIMSMGAVRVEVVAAAGHRQAAEVRHKPPKLQTIEEEDLDDE
ncbi:hypothetical protein PR202_gb21055 [Eleusine coracana subsp. coracana]|uniref:DUF7890 domain-containing protein n=1 Tax=Eleusine coracana subsp. coracana TaxID=191504 RepID=A0AAV5FC47_ELECO|nr:hypothetical protein QOZ80_7BG0601880 [Eleusine coracana subsp. coracana]GJN32541.1 hypothetical protein PR202_gb21055 [Eleusine coracana subsp. coracana]